MTATHKSPFSGSWYPADRWELESLLAERFAESERRTGCHFFRGAFGYVVPHAGPAYSGTVAAAVYRSLARERPDRVVLLAFPHRGGLNGVAVPLVECIATSLGAVEIDSQFAGFPGVPESHVCDHSFEIQLPFLQKFVPDARITPLYVGRLDAAARREAAAKIAEAYRPGTVFVASSDFTHYGHSFGHVPFPADGEVASNLRELDYACIDAAGSLDSALFLETIGRRNANACGTGPIALLLDVLRRLAAGGLYQSVLDYQTSGEITGDYRHSVSYAALGYFPASAFDLDESDRAALLEAAAQTLRRLRQSGERHPVVAAGSSALSVPRGAFVSLHQGEELLGCIGNRAGHRALREEIGELALAAALDDPRFRPAAVQTGPIDIEISLLTPFRQIRDTADFEVARHGAMLSLGRNAGLLLPQVAQEHGWSAAQFWRALARKSMLLPHAWSDPDARLEIFEAQRFGRKQAA
ncbi:MAG TPA: AmmeMemoRadiSam system protein B [Bryobacteraceae bacterium]|nr:AmmeMemoRadiSam system protein B [Bryobacteraceae bacterium]